MVGDGEQRDVRESLGNLEQRLLDLERELRTDASEDATVAQGAPAPKQKGKRAAREAAAAEEQGGGVAAPPAPPEDIDLFAADARAKVAALRETLDGLTSATDRLRETAQTVVEDHGRALVRLERATGAPAPVILPAAAAAAMTPPAETVAPREPAEPEPEPPAEPTAAVEAPVAEPQAPAATPEPEPAAEPEAESHPEPAPAADTPTIPPRPSLTPLVELPWRRLLLIFAAILAAVLGYTFLTGGNDSPKAPAGPSGIAATDAAITAAGGGITAIPDLRTGVEADVRRDLCTGTTAAAIHVITPGAAGWSCPGLREVAAPVLVASGFARQTARGRTCVSVPSAPGVDRRRRDAALTEKRDAAVRGADRAQAFAAGRAFDRRNGLTLLAGAAAPGKTCIAPTAKTLRDGSYPLATRLVLYSTADAADSAEVQQAAARLRTYFNGTPPLYAVVLKK